MNIYTLIILAAIVAGFAVDVIADILNLKALKEDLPEEFEGVYDEESYRKSQAYTRTRTKYGFITGTFDTVVLLVFWFSGGFNLLDTWVRSFGYNELISGLIFIAVLLAARSLLSLPFSIYSTFVIEERYGFNKTTPGVFAADLVKGLLLAAVIGLPVLAVILSFFIYAGPPGWLYAWAAVTVFTLIMQYAAPTLIMPLFNTFTPLEEGSLRQKIEQYTNKVNFPLKGLFIIDGSKRSAKSNAFFTGFGKRKRIALYDTLVENHSEEELVSILAHEVGHYKKKHILKGLITGILHTGVLFFLLSFFLHSRGLAGAFYMEHISVYAGLIFFGLLYAPVEMALSVFLLAQSRRHEFEADAYAAETADNAGVMISALKKLSKDNLSNLTPHPFTVFLSYSHPPVLQRIKALRKYSAA